jgi:hypothetical protein
MPERQTVRKAKKQLRRGKSASTAAGEFIREEIHHIREGKHGARSTKQAIAIGLSKARRAGVPLGTPKRGGRKLKAQAARERRAGKHPHAPAATRSRATKQALKREPRRAASHEALSRHAHRAATKRTAADRSRSARKAAATRKHSESSR